MKKIVLLALLPFISLAQQWQPMGPNDQNRIASGSYNYEDFSSAIDTNGVIYATANELSTGRLVYKTYQNGQWSVLASKQKWQGSPAVSDVVSRNGKVYFVHWDSGFYIEEYKNGNLVPVGQPIPSPGYVKPFLEIDSTGMPLLAILKTDVQVYRYNGISWDSTQTNLTCSRSGFCKLFDFKVSPSGKHFILAALNDVSSVSFQSGTSFMLLQDSINYVKGILENTLEAFLSLDDFDTPYVVYRVLNSHWNALRLQNNQWKLLNKGHWFKTGYTISNISFDANNTPFILGYGSRPQLAIKQLWLDGDEWRLHDSTELKGSNESYKISFQIADTGKRYFGICDEYTDDMLVYEYTGFGWQGLGNRDISNGLPIYPLWAFNIETDQNGAPWIGYHSDGTIYLLRFDGVNWLPQKEFPVSTSQPTNYISGFDYLIHGDTQIVAFIANDSLTCTYLVNNQWQKTKTALPLTANSKCNIDIIHYNNILISYSVTMFQLYVYRYNGVNISQLGNALPIGYSAEYTHRLTHNSVNQPFVSFKDFDSIYRLSVMHFNGSTWNYLGGKAYFQYSNTLDDEYMDIAVSNTDVLHFIYTDNYSWPPVTRMYTYQNANWLLLPSLDSVVENVGLGNIFFDSNNDLHVACVSRLYPQPPSVNLLRFASNQWQFMGNADLSSGGYYKIDVAFHGQMKYILYNARGIYAKALGPVAAVNEFPQSSKASPYVAFPNPSSGYFFLKSDVPNNLEFSVVDVFGRTVLNGWFYNGTSEVHLNHFPAGLYIIKISDGQVLKLLKQ